MTSSALDSTDGSGSRSRSRAHSDCAMAQSPRARPSAEARDPTKKKVAKLAHADDRMRASHTRRVWFKLDVASAHSTPRVSGARAAMTSVATPARHVRDDAAGPSAVTPAAKRARHGARHHPSEYIPGSVMKVKLHNFMTYSDVEMEPGPRLNVILGPNGTGKSSFVCALAIGLAGSTKLLGRADKLSEFVKRGEQSGYSEITLATKDPDRPLLVRREIKRKDSSSTWRVNNVVVTQERVKQEMHKLGVQLDNLCQFLPQDRVVEFARLSPEQLLLETEKAIGNAELFKMHEELVEKKKGIEGLEREVRGADARRPRKPSCARARRETRLARILNETWHPSFSDDGHASEMAFSRGAAGSFGLSRRRRRARAADRRLPATASRHTRVSTRLKMHSCTTMFRRWRTSARRSTSSKPRTSRSSAT